jgi:methionyl-tRNA formyltransferase
MRVIFMGTPDFAVPTLNALVAAGHDVCAVYSQPPRPANRGKKLTPGAVHKRAEELGLEVRNPLSLKGAEEQAAFAALGADVAVVAAYGLILPQVILDAPKHGCLNVHGSLLPRWRGAAPVQRAILAGDHYTGVCIMQMEAGLDTGPVRFAMEEDAFDKNAGELTAELGQLGAHAIVRVLADLDSYPPIPQPTEGVTYAAKVNKSEYKLNFEQSIDAVMAQIQAFNPPGCYFEVQGERIRVLKAQARYREHDETPGTVINKAPMVACKGTGAVELLVLQRAGRGAMPAQELLRGFPIPAGTILK